MLKLTISDLTFIHIIIVTIAVFCIKEPKILSSIELLA